MSLTATDVVWYNPVYDTGTIIDSCREFNNVPQLGIGRGISYTPVLARRQFGYPLKQKPLGFHIERMYYHNQSDSKGMRDQVVRAWHTIHRKDSNQWVISLTSLMKTTLNGLLKKLLSTRCLTLSRGTCPRLPQCNLCEYSLVPGSSTRRKWMI